MPRRPTIATLLKRIEAAPRDAELHQELGLSYRKKGLMEEAKVAYERSLELDPFDPWTHLYLGNWYFTMDQYREAVECFNCAARLMPQIAIAFVSLGHAYAALGFDALATQNYRHALDVDPDDKTAKRNWQRWKRSCEPKG
ncbi:MAG: tetratricopeptide repeat protein [Limisphaerales bacterium]